MPKSFLTTAIEHQLNQPTPLFSMDWYMDRHDHYVSMCTNASYVEMVHPDYAHFLPANYLGALADYRMKLSKQAYAIDQAGAAPYFKPFNVAMFNLSKAMPKASRDEITQEGMNLTLEFLALSREVCSIEAGIDAETNQPTDILLLCPQVTHKENTFEINGYKPENKFLFIAFLQNKGLLDYALVEDDIRLGKGQEYYDLALETLHTKRLYGSSQQTKTLYNTSLQCVG